MVQKLALDFVRTTEAAAMSAAWWVGKGNKKAADQAATEAMRKAFNQIDIDGTVVIGEGERDEAPMLFIGEKVGTGNGPKVDIAVDPLECTNFTARGEPNSIAVFAAAPSGTLLHAPDGYMQQIGVGQDCVGTIDLDASPEENITAVARCLGKDVKNVSVIMLERDYNAALLEGVRKTGCKIMLVRDGTVWGAIASAMKGTGIDLFLGSGAAPEGVISAVALKCLEGEFQGRLWFKSDEQKVRAGKMGITDLQKKYTMNELVRTDNALFIATGVTAGPFLNGVELGKNSARTHSVVMNAQTKSIRYIDARHTFA
ncbi:MAG: class II fructose-bisphosphatase [Nanoarchaeota archaeon]|nr:class II fructose-bisphosphatase [Nanoarchaeota archaeon]